MRFVEIINKLFCGKNKPDISYVKDSDDNFVRFNFPKEHLQNIDKSIKMAASELRSRDIFPGFSNEENFAEDQQWRMIRADDPFIYIDNLATDRYSAEIVGKSGCVYHTSMNSCDCEDYQKRHKPCKHMYKLAFYTGKMNPYIWCKKDHEFKNIHNDIPKGYTNGDFMAFKPYLISYGEDQEFIYGQTEDDALGYSNLYRQYHRDPDKIIRQEYDRPTDRQILYARKLGIEIPTRCCKEDLSTLLDGGTIGNMPDRHITEYLIEKRINFSYYATDEILIEIAYDNGDPQEKIALWIVMIDWIQTNRWDFSAMKELNDNPSKNYGISQADMYQMFAYAERFETPDIWLLYPAKLALKGDVGISYASSAQNGKTAARVRVFFVDVVNIGESLRTLVQLINTNVSFGCEALV